MLRCNRCHTLGSPSQGYDCFHNAEFDYGVFLSLPTIGTGAVLVNAIEVLEIAWVLMITSAWDIFL